MNKKIVSTMTVISLAMAAFFSCNSGDPNTVAQFFTGAELQYETEGQRDNMVSALNDILTLPEDKLKGKRYKDFRGNENRWNLPTLIYRHFVPDKQEKTLGNRFYHDVKKDEVQSIIRNILQAIQSDKTE